MPYDVSLGGVDLPTYEMDFDEQGGSDYTLVGAAVLPGPPRPLRFYNITFDVHGEPEETDVVAAGLALRLALRSLLENATARFQGLEFTSSFDPDVDAWIVIGQYTLPYANEAGPNFGEFQLRVQQAAVIPAQQTLLGLALYHADATLPTTPLDTLGKQYRPKEAAGSPAVKHYLPVGAQHVQGQADPVVVPTQPYSTIYGEGLVVQDRPHGELLTMEVPWPPAGGDVRVYDRRGKGDPAEFTTEGDLAPVQHYGWGQACGPTYPCTPRDIPVLCNGRCRVRWAGGGKFCVDVCKHGSYSDGAQEFDVGYATLLYATVHAWERERAVVKALFASGSTRRAEVYITLQRGWPGPAIDVYHLGAAHRHYGVVGTTQVHQEDGEGWDHLRLGASKGEGLARTWAARQIAWR